LGQNPIWKACPLLARKADIVQNIKLSHVANGEAGGYASESVQRTRVFNTLKKPAGKMTGLQSPLASRWLYCFPVRSKPPGPRSLWSS
jgi:hypothetical protein